jgi:hypothetical protein
MRKKFLCAVLSLAMLLSMIPVTASAARYEDTENHWAESSIDRFSNYGVIQGYDGSFNPDDDITRGQMAVAITNLMQLPEAPDAGFADVAEDAYYKDAGRQHHPAGFHGHAGPGPGHPAGGGSGSQRLRGRQPGA